MCLSPFFSPVLLDNIGYYRKKKKLGQNQRDLASVGAIGRKQSRPSKSC